MLLFKKMSSVTKTDRKTWFSCFCETVVSAKREKYLTEMCCRLFFFTVKRFWIFFYLLQEIWKKKLFFCICLQNAYFIKSASVGSVQTTGPVLNSELNQVFLSLVCYCTTNKTLLICLLFLINDVFKRQMRHSFFTLCTQVNKDLEKKSYNKLLKVDKTFPGGKAE